MFTRKLALAVAVLGVIGFGQTAAGQGSLNVYCSVQNEWCQAIVTNFQRDTGIRVNMTQRGSGESLAAIRAEAQNPRADVWFGGTGDPHLAAAEENLTQAYESANNAQLQPWALTQWRQSQQRAIGVDAGAIGFGINTELLARKNIAPPACWADVLDARFKGEIQMANPNSSGKAYVVIATLVQLMGEDPASGASPIRPLALLRGSSVLSSAGVKA
jgi:iron(III) transport system substrate-binding protein